MSRNLRLCIVLLFAGAALQAQAQNITLQSRIDSATQTLVDLDALARSCLESTEKDSGADTESGSSCVSFLAAIDGQVLAGYLDHCQNLKAWRDDYVTQTHGTGISLEQDPTVLQTLVGIEYACGENALQKRTVFVAEVFALVRNSSRTNHPGNNNALRRIAEFEFNATADNERRLLLQSLQQQHSRRLQETQNQFDKLETELIRQQINN